MKWCVKFSDINLARLRFLFHRPRDDYKSTRGFELEFVNVATD